MQKRFNTLVTQFDGNPWKDDKGEDLTVGKAVVTALMATFEDERTLGGEEKLKRYILAERIYGGAGSGPVEVTAEDLALIKKCVAKAFNIGVVGFVLNYLEEGDGPTSISSVKKRAS